VRTLAEGDRDKTKLETEAEAFRQRTLAEANRDTTKLNTEAETNRRRAVADAEADAIKAQADGDAFAQRTVAGADAEAINVRADALHGENQALIAANKLVDLLPALVEASARGIAGSNLTVLNGTDGVNQVAAGVVAQGLSIYESLRQSVARDRAPLTADGDRSDAGAPASSG
jgi:uncharacterized membrane protein YqiK